MGKELAIRIKKVPLYPCRLGILIEEGYNGMNKFLKSQGAKYYLDFKDYIAAVLLHGCIKKRGELYDCIYIVFNIEAGELTHGLIAHEVRHATNGVLNYIGQKLDAENDEVEAYLAQWVTKQVYKALKKGGYLKCIKL